MYRKCDLSESLFKCDKMPRYVKMLLVCPLLIDTLFGLLKKSCCLVIVVVIIVRVIFVIVVIVVWVTVVIVIMVVVRVVAVVSVIVVIAVNDGSGHGYIKAEEEVAAIAVVVSLAYQSIHSLKLRISKQKLSFDL